MNIHAVEVDENCRIAVGEIVHVSSEEYNGDFLVKEIDTTNANYSSGIEVLIEVDRQGQSEAWIDQSEVEF